MTKNIDAEKLIAEIDCRLHCNCAFDEVGDYQCHYDQGMIDAYKHIREVVTDLQQEQSEMDLEEEIKEDMSKYKHMEDVGGMIKDGHLYTMSDFHKLTARHFYELGLKARKEE